MFNSYNFFGRTRYFDENPGRGYAVLRTGIIKASNKEEAVEELNSNDITVEKIRVKRTYKGELEKVVIKEDRVSGESLDD
ncbi:hypothetical protein GF378_00340 [Candidatus Pacearchaeota archaeon]|nr:hypothetical protein [Candidatus Pacearchaeota archaeon]